MFDSISYSEELKQIHKTLLPTACMLQFSKDDSTIMVAEAIKGR